VTKDDGMPSQPLDDWKAFLLDRPRPGVLATANLDGRPHAAPVWFDVDADTIVFNTGESTVKARNLRHNPRAALVVQDDTPPFTFVLVQGTVELSEDLEQVRAWAGRIGGRYMGAERADEYGARNGVPGELLARLTPTNVVSAADLAD
jgi:PPOX class probable F420-dependent enzyme